MTSVATDAMGTDRDVVMAEAATPGAFARFADRWIWAFTAALFLAAVLAGFIPSSIQKVQAIQAQQRPPFAWFLHIHAVAMGSWMLVLLAQAWLMATGQRRWHVSLGMASLALASLLQVMLLVMVGPLLARILALQAPLSANSFVLGVLGVQMKSAVLFPIFYLWGFLARHSSPDTHRRMMLLATASLIDAGTKRIPGADALMQELGLKWLGLDSVFDSSLAWVLMLLLPALLHDLFRRGRIHHAWVVGIALLLASYAIAHVLGATP